ncbi:phosphotransferase [Nitrincola alkalisediminis]|uniref:phosphotransferase n=1 Tax=Nitrincola alkalisediminis TaxID=1366656 RepID=UPI001874F4EF|nr:phosphotransferase [Nitrincola alkalisediminis]
MNLALPSEVKTQLVFLLAEVRTQLQNLMTLVETPSTALMKSITERSGHSYNLKQRVHARCLKAFQEKQSLDAQSLKAAGDIADELERIASLCRDAARELQQLNTHKMLTKHKYSKQLERIETALKQVEGILSSNDTQDALRIGQVKQKLAHFYKKTLNAHLKALKRKKETESLISSLFLARYFLEMGESLVNISESLIAVLLGQPMNMKQFLSLQAMVSRLGHQAWDSLSLETIAETRSGSAISAITNEEDDHFIGVLKEGELRKVQEERRGLQRWNSLFPGIAPQILSHHHQGSSGALIIEHLPGKTLEQMLLQDSAEELKRGLEKMSQMLPRIWVSTRRKEKAFPLFIQQLKKRLPAILNIHSSFNEQLKAHTPFSLKALLSKAEQIDNQLSCPFSVYIHGDFNLDNILYDDTHKQIRFIDLHRSRHMDYVQDVTVFIVSALRLPLFDEMSKVRVNETAASMFSIAQQFAQEQNDPTFEVRMALGLARSLITSTRFILDATHANYLFDKGIVLLNHIVQHDGAPLHQYRLPFKDVLHEQS